MRAFALFTDADGDPVAVRADEVVGVELSTDDDGNPDGMVVIITTPGIAEGDFVVQGPFEDVVKELEICIDDGNAWEL